MNISNKENLFLVTESMAIPVHWHLWQFWSHNSYYGFYHSFYLHNSDKSENVIFQTPYFHASKSEKLIHEWQWKKKPQQVINSFLLLQNKNHTSSLSESTFFSSFKGSSWTSKGKKNGRGLECFFSKVFAFCEWICTRLLNNALTWNMMKLWFSPSLNSMWFCSKMYQSYK